ncbi:DUF4132 domain-containing protein [Kitasatospora sp. NPDC057198]|uniref:DUF4132 domain-containing protein n=1 Tax=Kitasatospora sp. NPDC057198 TaxID=3346046 RepID=UPI003634B21F
MRHGGRVGGGGAVGAGGGGGELPDEDGFVLPEAWRAQVLPLRRGGVPVPVLAERPAVDPEGAWQREVRALDEVAGGIEWLLADELSAPGPAAALRAYLGGADDPVGAALAAAIVRDSTEPESLRREFEDRVAWAGLSFEVRAVLGAFEADLARWWTGSDHHYWLVVLDLESDVHFDLSAQYGLLTLARQALAEAPEEEYAAVVEELAPLRTTPVRRAVTAHLVPERTDWVDECLAELPAHRGRTATVLRTLLASALGSAEQLERFRPERGRAFPDWTPGVAVTLLDRIGPAAVPLLAAELGLRASNPLFVAGPLFGEFAALLAELPGDEAMRTLAGLTGRPNREAVRELLAQSARRFPVRAMRVLSAAVRDGDGGAEVREVLDQHVRLWRSRLPEILPRLDAASAAFVLSLDGAREPLPEAPPERLPALLAEPPWRWQRAAREPVPAVLTGLVADREPRLVWREGESAAYANGGDPYWRYPVDTDWAEALGELSPDVFDWRAARLLAWGPAELVTPYLADWQPSAYLNHGGHLRRILGRHGTAALRLLRFAARERPEEIAPALLPVLDATVAGVMAGLLRLKSVHSVARSWFARHRVAGALLLVPAALGPAGPERQAAEHALRRVAAAEGADVLLAAVAERYGERAGAAAAADVLGPGALLRSLPTRLPELPEWLRPGVLPQVLLANGGGALPEPAVRNLLTVLQLGRPHDPYPGLAAVVPALRADTAAAFAWALFEEWLRAGAPPRGSWALHALGELGDDHTARRLAPLLPRLSHQRQVDALDVLVAIGTADALAQLHGVAGTAKSAVLEERARERISEVAEALDLTPEQVADRLAPGLGLDADGSTVIDYGGRTFTVGFDERLQPYVLDAAGRRRKALPAAAAADDPDLVAAGRRRFTALKKEVRAFTVERTARLEAAMVAERSWSAGEFTDLMAGHPLLRRLARGLLWTVDGAAFRITEDGTFADVRDEPFELPADATTVRVAHPLHLTAADLTAWGELLADYEVVQPFSQLSRPVAALTEQEAAGHRLHRFEGRTVPVWRLLGMARRGWQQVEPARSYQGVAERLHRPLPDGRHLVLALDPGIRVQSPGGAVEQRLETVWLGPTSGPYPSGRHDLPERLGDLPAVLVSELLADLEELTSD